MKCTSGFPEALHLPAVWAPETDKSFKYTAKNLPLRAAYSAGSAGGGLGGYRLCRSPHTMRKFNHDLRLSAFRIRGAERGIGLGPKTQS